MSYECFAHFSSQKLSMIKKVLGQSLWPGRGSMCSSSPIHEERDRSTWSKRLYSLPITDLGQSDNSSVVTRLIIGRIRTQICICLFDLSGVWPFNVFLLPALESILSVVTMALQTCQKPDLTYGTPNANISWLYLLNIYIMIKTNKIHSPFMHMTTSCFLHFPTPPPHG